NPGQFQVRFAARGGELEPPGSDPSASGNVELASRPVRLGGEGETLTLSATSQRGNVGLLSAGILLFGLTLTYNLMKSRMLMLIQTGQTRRLAVEEQRFRSLFEHNPDAVFILDKDGRYQSINPVTASILGVVESRLIGVDFREVINEESVPHADLQQLHSAYEQAARGYARPGFTMAFQPFGEAPRYFDLLFVPILVDRQVEGVFGIAKDITARLRVEERQRIMERSLEASSNAVIITDARQQGYPVVYVNPAFTQMSGYSATEVEGQTLDFMVGGETDPEDVRAIRSAVARERSASLTIRSYRKDGALFWNQLFISPVRDTEGVLTHFIAVMNDISERKEQDQQLAYQATHDVLTGLGNRSLFHDRLHHDFELARRHQRTLAILFVDLDEFKPINDTLGHKVGDRLLISVTERLRQIIRPSDTLARFGGDEFVLLLPDLEWPEEAQEVAERLLHELARPHQVDHHELHISASIGIATISDEVEEPEKLLQRADMAMYKAKQQGRNTWELFSSDLDTKLMRRLTLRNDLQEAIEQNQLYLVYQPVLDRNGAVEGLEALLRWNHPEKGLIPPSDFIPIAEETGQIVPLGLWVLEQACADALDLLGQGLLSGTMAVNLSPLQFHRPNFLPTLRKLLEACRLPPEHLELELTEGILMKDTEGAIDILNALSGLGVRTAIDDFGTGYSSFAYLRELPVDKIKIDRSFVMDVTSSEKDSAVCKGVITLARELDLKVVAEGVETEAQFRYLKALGCEAFQGYWFAYPMRKEELIVWLRVRRD
ncbi:MAG: EAL domain-containing protein, partial [Marinobacter sp.]